VGSEQPDLAAAAREIVDSNRYMTLATADGSGRPWVSPVWYASVDYTSFHWVSSPDAAHSRNLLARPEVSIVIFDSQVPIGEGQAVYMAATAEELTGNELERGIEIFSQVSQSQGAASWSAEDVSPPAPLRLYRATASEHSMLDKSVRGVDQRTAVSP
jgi:nitroimidazol reductase NimA-like FMN-containing flavoprotein (pyridoxamine 5'-phosphate oxidase superfamily)